MFILLSLNVFLTIFCWTCVHFPGFVCYAVFHVLSILCVSVL